MGTSISQPSLRNTNWSPVHAGYKNKFVPEERVINEIWRASEKDDIPISQSLKSDAIYECYSVIENSKTFQEALQKFNDSIIANKNNSIIAEFAKRAIPIAFQSEQPANNWASRFFAEVTNYVMSRDTSGFVGEKYRNKSVSELVNFKKSISGKVAEIINAEKQSINNKNDWNAFVDQSINKLKSGK